MYVANADYDVIAVFVHGEQRIEFSSGKQSFYTFYIYNIYIIIGLQKFFIISLKYPGFSLLTEQMYTK